MGWRVGVILSPWRLSYLLTNTRTVGEIGLNKNFDSLDIWIRVNGEPKWFAVPVGDVEDFLRSDHEAAVFRAESEGNAE